MAIVAQGLEHWFVVPGVEGSNPFGRPLFDSVVMRWLFKKRVAVRKVRGGPIQKALFGLLKRINNEIFRNNVLRNKQIMTTLSKTGSWFDNN